MGRRDGGGREELQREVAVGDAVQRVARRLAEAERPRRGVAVDGKARAGQRGGAERAFVEPRAASRTRDRSRPNIST